VSVHELEPVLRGARGSSTVLISENKTLDRSGLHHGVGQ
jgi:hypothetical protein